MKQRWTVHVSRTVDRDLRAYLVEHGGRLSHYVEEAVEERLYRLATEEVQARNADLEETVTTSLVEVAQRWSRAGS